MSFRTYNQVQGEDRSRLGDQVAAQRARVRDRLSAVGHVVAVTSGKGGVGKSYVTAALARALAATQRVGVLDADLHGPTAARLLGATGQLEVSADGVTPAVGDQGIPVVSTELLLDEGSPLRWRGASHEGFVSRSILEAGALREFLSDVAWGPLDILLVDMPPGTARLDDLAELVPATALAGALVVTIPSDESRRAVERAMRRAGECNVRVLGVVENMSGAVCERCGHLGPLFHGDAGAALAAAFDVPLLARIPFDPAHDGEHVREHVEALAHALLEVLP